MSFSRSRRRLQLWHRLIAHKLYGKSFILTLVFICILIFTWTKIVVILARAHLAPSQTTPDIENTDELKSIVPTTCQYPDFVITQRDRILGGSVYGDFDIEDPTARARVGPNPQHSSETNYTVIYNFAAPYSGKRELYEELVKDRDDYVESQDQKSEDRSFDDEEELVAVDPVLDEDHITFATHATPEFLVSNLKILLLHWPDDPISVSVYTPGSDFCLTAALISWLWTCQPQIRRQVSFHLFFPSSFANQVALKTANEGIRILDVDCLIRPDVRATYRLRNHLEYPINTARNIARTAADTRYILNSDIELRPSKNLSRNIVSFLKSGQGESLVKEFKVVFAVPIFEVEETESIPQTKRDLIELVSRQKAVYFHKNVCETCQKIPGLDKWLDLRDTGANRKPIYRVTKRKQSLSKWEPTFIGTHEDPWLDERLSWEGYRDKLSQILEMCLLNYRFAILSSDFLVHKPGIKKSKEQNIAERQEFMEKNSRIFEQIKKDLASKYSYNPDCLSD